MPRTQEGWGTSSSPIQASPDGLIQWLGVDTRTAIVEPVPNGITQDIGTINLFSAAVPLKFHLIKIYLIYLCIRFIQYYSLKIF